MPELWHKQAPRWDDREVSRLVAAYRSPYWDKQRAAKAPPVATAAKEEPAQVQPGPRPRSTTRRRPALVVHGSRRAGYKVAAKFQEVGMRFWHSILRLRNEATTGSSPCRWRSVWRISPSDISTATAPSTTWTSSDNLSLDQKDEIDVGQLCREKKEAFGGMHSYHHEVSRCCCLYSCSCLMIDWARAIVLRNHNNIDA